jgi:RNA polymerase sigma-70 factor, ECF subfamily
MQQRLTRGEAAALGELYDRLASLVHGLAHRMLDDEDSVDRVIREVFTYVWEHPDSYDPKQGLMRSWIAGITQERAAALLRKQHCELPSQTPEQNREAEERILATSTAARADYIVTSMPASLRKALELAYFQRHDYRQTAARLGVTEDEARRRLRLGLQLLSSAMARPLPVQAGLPGRRR